MITGVSKAVVLVDDQDEARAVWSGHVGVDATFQANPAAWSAGSRWPRQLCP